MTPQKSILFNILTNPETFPLDAVGSLKREHFTSTYDKEIYHHVRAYYLQHGVLPALKDLRIFARSSTTLDLLEIPEDYEPVDTYVALEAIETSYIQKETLSSIKDFISKLDELPANDVIPKILSVATSLEDKLNTNDRVSTNKGFRLFIDQSELDDKYKPIGICPTWDFGTKGLLPGEVLLIGGRRGAGKSVVSANICIAQYCMGLISPYFTVEMTGDETRTRFFSILSGVDQTRLKHQKLEGPELLKALVTRSYQTAEELVVPELVDIPAIIAFDEELSKQEDKLELVIVEDRDLTMSVIDLTIGQLINKYGVKVSMAIIDYINVVRSDSANSSIDNLDWKIQMVLSQAVKNMANKHKLPIVSPYQTDANGEARLSKGLLDSVDFAFSIEKLGNMLSLLCAKARGGEEVSYKMPIYWKALKIMLEELPEEPEEENDDQEGPN